MDEKTTLIVELAAQMFVEDAHEIISQRGRLNAADAAERCLEAATKFYEVAAARLETKA